MKIIGILFFAFISTLTISCSNEDDNPAKVCGIQILVDAQSFDDYPNDFVSIDSVSISGDCLSITYGASGCDGESWSIAMLDSGSIAESLPVQRFLRLSMENIEACLAYFVKTAEFDLSTIKLETESEIILNIENYETILNYTY